MTTEAREHAETIFLALSHVPPDQRTQVLIERCGGDETLRSEVERLLAGLDLPDSFLESSPPRPLIGDGDALPSVGTAVGDFIVIREIGSGGTGVVYLAHQQHPPRVVALKMLRREFMASTVQRRFEIEAELLGHLHHPGIAQIYAAHPGDATTPPFIAMELVNGPPLTEYADGRQLSLHDRIELLARVGDAVQHAHQRGIIHRDLKPGNILVNEDGQPKVLDFGVARLSGSDISVATMETEVGQLLGTVAYMSPEQVRADPDAVDTRSDIHTLGVILFRLLTGRLPFGHDDPPLPELARRIVSDDAPRLGTIVPSLRGDLETIVSRALAKEKERRYASAAGLASDLRRYLAGQPIAASADSAWYTLRRQLGRYRLALGLSAVAGVALAALASYATYQRARADRVNVQLEDNLATSTIERGRLLSITGNHPIAEELVWRELFRRPDSNHARWTLWDIYSREPSLWESFLHEGGTQTVRFSPDSRRLLTSGRLDGLIRLIDVASKQVIWTAASTPTSGTLRALFTPDGRTVVSGSVDGSLRIWDAESGTLRRELAQAVAGLRDLAITGDGELVVTLSEDTVQAWSLATGEVVQSFWGLVYRGLCITASPTGRLALAGGEDGALTALDLSRQLPVWQVPGHGSSVTSVAIAPEERWLASGGEDGLVHLWDRASGKRLGTIAGENGTVRSLAFSANGNRLAATGYWRTRMWDMEQPALPPQDFGASEGMTDLHISPDNRTLATSQGGGGFVRLWDLVSDSRADHWDAHRAAVAGLAVATDGQWLFSAGLDGAIKKWQPGQPTPSFSLQPATRVGGLAVSQNGQWLASVGQPGPATVWNPADGLPVAGLSNAGSSRAILFFDDDRQLIVGDADGTLITWDWSSGVAKNPRKISTQDAEVLALATGGPQLYVAHRNQVISVRDTASGQEIRRLRPSAAPFSLASSPDARLIAAGTWIGTVDVWEAESGEKLAELKGPTALVTSLAFSPDGALLAVSSRDGSTRLWDVAEAQWLAIVASRKAGAERIRFFPDGRRLAIGYADGEVEIRDLQYFFRYVAGHAEYQLSLFRALNESLPRSEEVLAWTRQIPSASPR